MGDGIVSVVLGTAGHIDHGKSSLVRALTGIDPDRLKEEKDRELTIDLGFAPLRLSDGRLVGMVDVPGHERFVKNMVAGATGLDLVLLVVAADDGVMPQTREHLEILTLLGLRHGIVVISKIDVPGVDADLLGVLELELAELLEGTFLAGAPVLRVSSHTGEGLDALRAAIEAAVARVEPRSEQGAFRMPIQRVFSAQGFGTVLTGIPLEGSVALGDPVEVLTSEGKAWKGKVRGLQAYGQKVERVRAGHSSALNVTDVERKAVRRGDVVCTPGIFAPSTLWEARISYLSSQRRPLRQRETVRLHVGTAEVIGEVVLLEQPLLEPGASGLVQLRLHEPVVAAAGDRFVLRRHSPMETLGGGVLLGASRWRLKPGKEFVLGRLERKEAVLGQADETLLVELGDQTRPLKVEDLVRALKLPKEEVERLLAELRERGEVVEVSGGKGQAAWLSAAGFARAEDAIRAALAEFHAAHPARPSCPRLELKALGLADGVLSTALAALVQAGAVREPGRGLALAEHAPRLDEAGQAYREALLGLFQARAFQPPSRVQAEEELRPALAPGAAQDVFLALLEEGQLVSIGEDLVFHRSRYEEALERVRQAITAQGPLTAAAFRELLDTTRRYAIPFLEHLDEVGLTRREGDVRVLR